MNTNRIFDNPQPSSQPNLQLGDAALDYDGRPLPRQVTTVGVWLFLASLTMLFAGCMVCYVIIRLAGANRPVPGRPPVPLGSLSFPPELWGSTALVIGVSIALWQSLVAIHRERQRQFRTWTGIAIALAAGFIFLQTPAMLSLLSSHNRLRAAGAGNAMYGLIFVMILLHALHVLGGIIALGRVVLLGALGRLDHEHYSPVKHATMYWHFLDAVWIMMFGTFWLMR